MSKATDLAILLMVTTSLLPETVVGKQYLGVVPARFVALYVAWILLIAESAIAPGGWRWNPLRVVVFASMCYMAILGLALDTSFKFWVIDLSMFSGLLLGMHWASRRTLERRTKVLVRFLWLATLMAMATAVGLGVGLIPPAEDSSGRLYTYSLLTAGFLVSIGGPYWVMHSNQRGRALAASAVLLGGLAVSAISATRSVAILWLCSLAATTVLLLFEAKNRHRWSAVALLLALMLAVAWTMRDESYLAERFLSTNVQEETRFEEVLVMFDAMRDWTTGNGFGSRFWSPVLAGGENVAYAPHIAITTLIFKGGAFVFLMLVAFPLLRSVVLIGHPKGNQSGRSANAGVLLYFLGSSMSGGWDFLSLYLLGSFLLEVAVEQKALAPYRLRLSDPLPAKV